MIRKQFVLIIILIENTSAILIESRQNYRYPYYNRQSLLDNLYTVIQNDNLQCVPKLICETASGMMGRQNYELPLNLNMDSILSLLSTVNLNEASPILQFGKAIILGYTSKRFGQDSCAEAYPSCPRDPDRLIYYLNNHNGGFFNGFGQMTHIPGRYGKNLRFPDRKNHKFQYEKVPSNHRVSPFIYSDRTGTGDLKLDSLDFYK